MTCARVRMIKFWNVHLNSYLQDVCLLERRNLLIWKFISDDKGTKTRKFNVFTLYHHMQRCLSLSLSLRKSKVKSTLVQALRLCTGRTAHRGSRGIALPFLDHCTRRVEGSASRPGRSLPSGKTRYPLYRRLGGPQGRSGEVRENLGPTGIRSPDRPARSQSLCWLRYSAYRCLYRVL